MSCLLSFSKIVSHHCIQTAHCSSSTRDQSKRSALEFRCHAICLVSIVARDVCTGSQWGTFAVRLAAFGSFKAGVARWEALIAVVQHVGHLIETAFLLYLGN